MQLRISLTVSQILVESTEAWKGKSHFGKECPSLPSLEFAYVWSYSEVGEGLFKLPGHICMEKKLHSYGVTIKTGELQPT